jgi:hypothetical protein
MIWRILMNLEEYMDAKKFPLTSQNGSTVHTQLLLDAINFDQLEKAIADGQKLDEEQMKIHKELQIKRPWMKDIGRQAAAADKASRKKANKLPETPTPQAVSQEPETEDDEEDYAKQLGEAVMSIIYNETLSKAEKRKQILGALNLLDEGEDAAGELPKRKAPAKKTSKQGRKAKPAKGTLEEESSEPKPERPLRTPVEPFKPISAEELKTMCEQVHKILTVTRAQEQRNRELYREIYGEEMPDI